MPVTIFTAGYDVDAYTEKLKVLGVDSRALPVKRKYDYRGVVGTLIDDTPPEHQALVAEHHIVPFVHGVTGVVNAFEKDVSHVKQEKLNVSGSSSDEYELTGRSGLQKFRSGNWGQKLVS